MFRAYFAPLPDPAAYLRRIGLDPADYDRTVHPALPPSPTGYGVEQTKEALDRLIGAHLQQVPFENLDIYECGRVPALETEALFEKIVVQRRGGYCFELNALFFSLLQALGCSCVPLAQRVVRFQPDMPLCHRSTLVTLPDGMRLLCDVGYGGPTPVTALLLDETGLQRSGPRVFRIFRDGAEYHLRLVTPEQELPILRFTDQPFRPVDFLPLNFYAARQPGQRFNSLRVLSIIRPDGRVTMEGDTLRIRSGDDCTEATLALPEERRAAYTEYFGIPAESLTAF